MVVEVSPMKLRCTKCKKLKSTTSFYTHKKNPSGFEYRCKDCNKEAARKYREEFYPNRKSKIRPCLGKGCRGKLFKAYYGARVCHDCRKLIKNDEEVHTF